MKEETFTDFIINKLTIADIPLAIQEVVVKDLGEIILQRILIELLSLLSEDESERISIYIEANDFNGVYAFLTANGTYEKKCILIAEEIVGDFVKQLHL